MAKSDEKPRTEVRSIRLTKDELKQLEATASEEDRSVAYLLQRIMEAYSGSSSIRSAVKDYFKK
jgi:predicted DNA-binding ribbon-helix-helix protein